MPEHSLTELLELAQSDEALQAQLRTAATADDVVRIADSRGIHLTGVALDADGEISDAELEVVAGGTMMRTAIWYACQETLPRFC